MPGVGTPRFGTTGLLRDSDLVMSDDLTESQWRQFNGEAIVGTLARTWLTIPVTAIADYDRFKAVTPTAATGSQHDGSNQPGLNVMRYWPARLRRRWPFFNMLRARIRIVCW